MTVIKIDTCLGFECDWPGNEQDLDRLSIRYQKMGGILISTEGSAGSYQDVWQYWQFPSPATALFALILADNKRHAKID